MQSQCAALALDPEAVAAAVSAAVAAAEAREALAAEACDALIVAAAAALGRAARAGAVVCTRGEHGAVLWEAAESGRAEQAWLCDGFVAPTIVDSVGAGDAFLAGLLASRLRGLTPAEALEAGCKLGAFVASEPGATPRHDPIVIASLAQRTAEGAISFPLEL